MDNKKICNKCEYFVVFFDDVFCELLRRNLDFNQDASLCKYYKEIEEEQSEKR